MIQMALPERQPSNEVIVASPQMADISTAGSVYAAAPCSGMLVRAYLCAQSAISGADCTWTLKINAVAVTGTGTLPVASAAAGQVSEVVFSAPVFVNKGATVEWVSAGESSTTTIGKFSAVLRT
jgi:hypothetical protein